MPALNILLGAVIGIILGATVVYFLVRPQLDQKAAAVERELEERRALTEKETVEILEISRQEAQQIRLEAEKNIERRYQDVARAEERVDRRNENVDKQIKKLEHREAVLNKRQSRLDKRQNRLETIEMERRQQLEQIAALTSDEAKQLLLEDVEKEARQDMARIMREIEDEAQGKRQLPSDEMKGRIIGRNGRNIRAFEQAAGVDIIVDDTPEAVTVSSFDPVRREVARRALAKLIVDGRIHPARIEKLISDANEEVQRDIKEAGEHAAYEANVHGLHPEILKTLGRLKYRTSYGQNQLNHAVEASHIAAMLAAELGANIETAKMGALLHDLGKAMDHDQEGTHAQIGADFAKRFKVPPVVVNAIAAHHHEVEQETIEAIIVEAADAISGARPGARRENLENYIKRVRTLEEIATSFPGVESAYALQAGREIRILVKPNQIDDLAAVRLSKEISKNIEDSMQYPGQIQVTVIRETRAVGFAK
jgi:ribonuclease Y